MYYQTFLSTNVCLELNGGGLLTGKTLPDKRVAILLETLLERKSMFTGLCLDNTLDGHMRDTGVHPGTFVVNVLDTNTEVT